MSSLYYFSTTDYEMIFQEAIRETEKSVKQLLLTIHTNKPNLQMKILEIHSSFQCKTQQKRPAIQF